MLDRKLLLVAIGLMCTNTSVYAESRLQCMSKCSKKECADNPMKQEECRSICTGSNFEPCQSAIDEQETPGTTPKEIIAQEAENKQTPTPLLSRQLLEKNTEEFYKKIIADEYVTFKTIQCISKSIFVEEKEFKDNILKDKNKIKSKSAEEKEKSKKIIKYPSYQIYEAVMGQYYESLLKTYLITVFGELSTNPHTRIVTEKTLGKEQPQKIVSPFARELQGFITNAISLAAPIATQIPGFQGNREPEPNALDQYFNALSDEKLTKLQECMIPPRKEDPKKLLPPITFNDPDLVNFQKKLLNRIEYYQLKNIDEKNRAESISKQKKGKK